MGTNDRRATRRTGDSASARFRWLAATLLATTLLAACGGGAGQVADAGSTDEPPTAQSEATPGAATATPNADPATADVRTLEDATGTVEVPIDPERPVPTDGVFAANMYNLGVEPAALPADVKLQLSTYDEYLPDGIEYESKPEIGLQYDINLEALAAVDPDLVIATDFEAEELRDEMRAIAPTYFVSWGGNGAWQQRFARVAEVIGATERAEEVDAAFEEVIDGLPAGVTDQTVAFLRAADLTSIRLDILESSFPGSVARAAGIPVLDLSDEVDIDEDASWIDVSEEQLGLLSEADVIVVSDLSFYDPALDDTLSVMAGSPVWESLPAVEAGRVTMVAGPVYNGGNYAAATALLTALEEVLADGTG